MKGEKHQLLEDILADAKRDPLFFEDVLESTGITPRNLMQLYMIFKFKFDLGVELGRDPGWEIASLEFYGRGYMEKFSHIYDGRLTVRSTYEKLFGKAY